MREWLGDTFDVREILEPDRLYPDVGSAYRDYSGIDVKKLPLWMRQAENSWQELSAAYDAALKRGHGWSVTLDEWQQRQALAGGVLLSKDSPFVRLEATMRGGVWSRGGGARGGAEVAEGQPTAVTMASFDEICVKKGQHIFHSPTFRVYTSLDPIGIEIAGALKNVVAIAAGACVGLGFKSNALSALITRGLAELTRFGAALGANPLTFNGLGGVGDLFLTCSSNKSRNYTVGFRLAQGESLGEITKTLGSVAEGVATTKAAYQLGLKQGVRMSITTAVYRVLYEDMQVKQAVHDLLNASSRQEFE